MGKWDRRYYVPKGRGRNNKYKNWDQAPHMAFNWDDDYNDSSSSYGTEGIRVPSWEIEYCKSARVPWNKVVASKKYIVCYPTVLDWDGSASKEALENAKQRYWAMINHLPCDVPLPDPDMYIEKIDWNSYLDPEMMEDLERQWFNPDESSSADGLETINENVAAFEVSNDKNQPTVENPWEMNVVQSSESANDATQGWGQWGHSVNLSSENPWKQSSNQDVDSWNDNAWKSGNESSGWDQPVRREGWGTGDLNSRGWNDRNANVNQRGWGHSKNLSNENPRKQSSNRDVDSWNDNAWKSGNESSGWDQRVKREGWGTRDVNSRGWNDRNASVNHRGWNETNVSGHKPSNCGNYRPSRENQNSNGRDWRENGNQSWGKRDSEFQVSDSNNYNRSGTSFRGGCRKRESSVQYTSNYKSSRYQDHSNRYGRQV